MKDFCSNNCSFLVKFWNRKKSAPSRPLAAPVASPARSSPPPWPRRTARSSSRRLRPSRAPLKSFWSKRPRGDIVLLPLISPDKNQSRLIRFYFYLFRKGMKESGACAYVVTAHKSTAVSHSCVGNFTSKDDVNLIIGKQNRIGNGWKSLHVKKLPK